MQDYKHEIERLQREMNEVKGKYFEMKRAARSGGAGGSGGGGEAGDGLIPAARPGAAAPAQQPASPAVGLLGAAAPSPKASPAASAVSLVVGAL